jgi:hypothetical protein
MAETFLSLLEEVDGRHLRYILKRAMADFSIFVSFLPITDIFLSPEAWNQDWKLLKKKQLIFSANNTSHSHKQMIKLLGQKINF